MYTDERLQMRLDLAAVNKKRNEYPGYLDKRNEYVVKVYDKKGGDMSVRALEAKLYPDRRHRPSNNHYYSPAPTYSNHHRNPQRGFPQSSSMVAHPGSTNRCVEPVQRKAAYPKHTPHTHIYRYPDASSASHYGYKKYQEQSYASGKWRMCEVKQYSYSPRRKY